jgi:O-acetylserine/cysteine efflux transporter
MSPRDIALAVFIAVLWGGNFIVMKHAVSEVPPLLLTVLRFALAAVPAVFLIARPKVPWGTLIGYGMAFGVVKFGLLFTAFKMGGAAGLASVLLQTQVFFTILLAQAVMGERVSARQRLGIGVALVGVVVIIAAAWASAAAAPGALIVAAAIAWGIANLIQKRAGKVDMLAFTVWTALVVPLPMLALSYAVEGPAAWQDAWAHLTWLGAGTVLYLAYPVSILGGAIWGDLLARYPAAQVAPFALLVPVIGMAAGAVVYGEQLTPANVAGSGLILAGLALIMLAGRTAPAEPARKKLR